VTGTTSDVTALVQLDGRPIGNGTPGRITRQLMAALEKKLYSSSPRTNPALAGAR
jgi:branched-subunit amino acid aminotransferase/4-amino-4-deoxychorismate lyase